MKAKCKTPGHSDLLILCSCGYEKRLPHGTIDEMNRDILYHRIKVLEDAVGIKIEIEYKA